MNEEATRQPSDDRLLPLLGATDERKSQELVEQLLAEHAESVIKPIIRTKLRSSLGSFDRGSSVDAEDVFGDVLVKLLTRLRDFKSDPSTNSINNFVGYVATTTYNACNEFLREKYPARARLKNRLRYLLTHHRDFALWGDAAEEWFCGLAVWPEVKKASSGSGRLAELCDDVTPITATVFPGERVDRKPLAELVGGILRWVDGPVKIDSLVTLIARLLGIQDHPPELGGDRNDRRDPWEKLPAPRVDLDREIDERRYLGRLWAEIAELPLRQRTALLLNVRDASGRGVIALFPLTGVASMRDIATRLEMPAREFAELWNRLPLPDSEIAERLGVTRQQVINLRKSARERLARRTKGSEVL